MSVERGRKQREDARAGAQILPVTECAFACLGGNGLCVILNDVANWRIVGVRDFPNLCVRKDHMSPESFKGQSHRNEDY